MDPSIKQRYQARASAYFIFSTEERLRVKDENPGYSICEVAKELGRRWAEMDPSIKQRYQARAEEERQKYDVDMASYRQGTFAHEDRTAPSPGGPGGGGGGQASR